MQDHRLDASGASAPQPIEDLDLVTAELRRRIAGIGLAIAELREETGRLRASADGRYPAVAVLDRPSGAEPGRAAAAPSLPAASRRTPETVDAPAGAVIEMERAPAEPVSPWRPASAAVPSVERATSIDGDAAGDTLTWVPESPPAAAPMVVAQSDVVVDATVPVARAIDLDVGGGRRRRGRLRRVLLGRDRARTVPAMAAVRLIHRRRPRPSWRSHHDVH